MGKIHVTKGSGKMDGIYSINTSTKENKFCQQMAKTSDVCKACYALRYEKMRKHLHEALLRNDATFKDEAFTVETLPYTFVRIHSFGELINATHLNNLMKLAIANPKTHFSLYTKRANLVWAWIRKNGKLPSNMLLVYSNPSLNNERKTPPKGFHKVFNVFEKKYAKENGIEINCGGKSCMSCMICYSFDSETKVNEIKK